MVNYDYMGGGVSEKKRTLYMKKVGQEGGRKMKDWMKEKWKNGEDVR